MALPPKMSRCCAGGIPSFSSSLALIWFVCESARPTRCDELAPNVPARVDRLRLLARAGRACASHATNRAPACYSAGHKPSLIDFLYQLTRSVYPELVHARPSCQQEQRARGRRWPRDVR